MNVTRNGPTFAYSCVIDAGPRFAYQAWHLAHSLIRHCGALPSDIHVQCTPSVPREVREIFAAHGFATHELKPFGDGRYCNKLAQIENLRTSRFDVAALLDTDTIAVSDLRPWLQTDVVVGKIVDRENPPLATLERVAELAQIEPGAIVPTDNGTGRTFTANCNGGMYSIPRSHCALLSNTWRQWATWLLANIEPLSTAGKTANVDQVSFWLAVQSAKLPFSLAPSNANYFIHAVEDHHYHDVRSPIALLHYHNTTLDDAGMITAPLQASKAHEAIDIANHQFGIDTHPSLRKAYLQSHGRDASEPARRSQHRTMNVQTNFGEMCAFVDDLITEQLINYRAHTRTELAFLLAVLDPGDTVFDLGAHIGTFTLPLASRIGQGGRLLAVEAAFETFELLQKNIGRLEASNVVALNCLIAPSTGAYAARTLNKNSGATFFLPAIYPDAASPLVGTSIDQLCADFFIPRVVKIDLEGFEAHAFQDAARLWPSKPIIYAEISRSHIERTGQSVETLDQLFRAQGYRFFRNVGDRNAAHDNFIVAELESLDAGGPFFDLLAIHCQDERISRIAP